MTLSSLLALTLTPSLIGSGQLSRARMPSVQEESVSWAGPLDIHVSGFPFEGETLTLEVRGPSATSFLLRVDLLPGEPRTEEPGHGFIPGSRAASPATLARASRLSHGFVLHGTTDADGLWREPFRAPEAGTVVLVRGIAVGGAAEALELAIQPPRNGDRCQGIAPSSQAMTTPGVSSGPGTPVPPGRGTRPCAREDVPDPNFADTNCDGIDGDIARAIFVSTSGSPFNPGTMDLPVESIWRAVSMAAADPTKDHVYVSEGVYPGWVLLREGVSIWGGYSEQAGWARSDAYSTILLGDQLLTGGVAAITGNGLSSPVTVSSLRILAHATGNSDDSGYPSVYGIRLHQCSNVTLEGLEILSGDAATGLSGYSGQNGTDGARGEDGGTGPYNGTDPGSGGEDTVFGVFSGGRGGWGAGAFSIPPLNGETGDDGGGPAGGRGGSGGGWISGGQNGGAGGAGAAGSAGPRGSNVGFITSGGLWYSNGDGNRGGDGAHGSGGGGGGGGSLDLFLTTLGGGGGGGGAGGSGATGGYPGRAGGSSIALLLSQSTVVVTRCEISAGNGGKGGNGGAGGVGGRGGAGGNGYVAWGTPSGGNGGRGGNGGTGGAGAGGGGGNSYAVALDALSSLTMTDTVLSISSPGDGGLSPGGVNGLPGEALLVKQL